MKHYIIPMLLCIVVSYWIIALSYETQEVKLNRIQLDHLIKSSFYLKKKTQYIQNDTLYHYYDSLYNVEQRKSDNIDSILIFKDN